MTLRRDVLLEEMGLGPRWVRRQGLGARNQGSAADEAPSSLRQGPGMVPPPAGAVHLLAAGDERAARIAGLDWDGLKAAVAGCQACALARSRTHTVFGVGDERASLLIVGEAPGAEEDARGEPFVGQAGRLLDNMLAAIGLKRGEDVYIANVLKCRPPGNRNPEPFEVAQCSPHLERQIDLIRPQLILAMGRFAAQTLLATDASIVSMRSRLHRFRGVPAIVTYHPAYLLRTLPDKAKAWEDLVFTRRTLEALKRAAAAAH